SMEKARSFTARNRKPSASGTTTPCGSPRTSITMGLSLAARFKLFSCMGAFSMSAPDGHSDHHFQEADPGTGNAISIGFVRRRCDGSHSFGATETLPAFGAGRAGYYGRTHGMESEGRRCGHRHSFPCGC